MLDTKKGTGEEFPKDPEDRRRDRYGKLSGDGLSLFGSSDEDSGKGGGGSMAINSFLWRATLDTLSFVPLAQADPVGGVILTDWYENPEVKGERYKINAMILDKRLRVDALRVSVFKQRFDGKGWRDDKASDAVARELENKILARAREMRIAQAR